MTVHGLLSAAAQARPDSILVVDGAARVSYGEIEARAGRIAHLLRARGVGRGDRVGLLLPNSAGYIAAYFGILRAGAVAVPLHTGQVAASLAASLSDCGAVALIVGEGPSLQSARGAAGSVPTLRAVVVEGGDTRGFPETVTACAEKDAAGERPAPPADVDPSDAAVIVYTSGSTGKPRGAVLRHGNIVANTRSIVRYLELGREDRAVVVLPFPYVYGASLLHTHVAVGGSLVLHGSTVFPNKILDAIVEHEATGFAGVPSTFAILLHRSDIATRRFPTLRYVTQAGGPLPPAHVRRLVDALPGTRVIVMYGATEASARLTWLPPEHLPRKLGSIGVPIPDVELKILREDGSEAAVDEVGEIVAQGPNIMAGYWGDPAATAEVLDAAGFHTGDLGRRDADGFFWVAGRKREMIKSGAHRISPREIEDVLLLDPAVEEAAVVGHPDEVLGEVVVAHVTARPGQHPSPEGLKRLCQEKLAAAKVPAAIHVREAMPRNAAGKVDKLALRATASAG